MRGVTNIPETTKIDSVSLEILLESSETDATIGW